MGGKKGQKKTKSLQKGKVYTFNLYKETKQC